MDYTTLERVKLVLKAEEEVDDSLLAKLISTASREIDRRCSQSVSGRDYFTRAVVQDEILRSLVGQGGAILCYSHKAALQAVQAFAYRLSPVMEWIPVEPERVSFAGGTVSAWVDAGAYRGQFLQVRISYEGGVASTPDELPPDLVEAATVLTIRYYKEGAAGLTDIVGVAEMGMPIYTKAIPARVKETLQSYLRVVPW